MTKLKEKRQELGLTQIQLAEKTGLSVRIIQHYEQGSKIFDNARIDRILKICIALNCRFDEVIENKEYIQLIHKYISSQK